MIMYDIVMFDQEERILCDMAVMSKVISECESGMILLLLLFIFWIR